MSEWINMNIGTLAVALVLAAAVAAVVRYIIREKRAGHSFCAGTSCGGGGCSGKCELCHMRSGQEASCCSFPKDIKINKL